MRHDRTRPAGLGMGNITRKPSRSGFLQPIGTLAWTLPSGKPLAEFALQAGFLAPPLSDR